MKTIMSSTNADVRKKCRNCLRYVEIYITCFKCGAAYHIYCWKKVSGAYVNEGGQLFCCSTLTSNYVSTDTNLGTQDDPPERVTIKEENVDDSNEDLENYLHKEEDLEWCDFRCGACLLELRNQEHLDNHYSECPNKEGELIQELKEDKDVENHLSKGENSESNKEHLEKNCSQNPNKHGETLLDLNKDKAASFCPSRNEENLQKESSEQHIKRYHAESSYSRLNKNNDTCITDTKRKPVQVDHKVKKYKLTVCNYSTPSHLNDDEISFNGDRVGKESHFSSERYDGNEKYDFNCDRCDYVAARQETLNVHILARHSNAGNEYKWADTDEKPFKCGVCDYAAAQKKTLNDHILRKHFNGNKEFKCGDCKYSTHRKDDLARHARTHTNEKPFKCDRCDYAAARKESLSIHILTKHSNVEKMYKCKDCKYSTHIKTRLATHTRTHNKRKSFKCVVVRHSNGDIEYKCKDCEYSTRRKDDLVRHKCAHTNEKQSKNDTCDNAAASKQTSNVPVLGKRSNGDKEYKCGDCIYSTYRKDALVRHKHIHTSEKPFKCDMCDYTAARKESLNLHILTKHPDVDKPYMCGDCNYSTHTKASLVNHVCVHANEQTFKCDMCEYTTSQKASLQVHRRKHSNVKKIYRVKRLRIFQL